MFYLLPAYATQFRTIDMNCMTQFSQARLANETFPSCPDCTGCRLGLFKVVSLDSKISNYTRLDSYRKPS